MSGVPAETRVDAAPAAATQLVVLVRHAEKSLDPSADPALTVIGQARARALQLALAQADVGAIISSQWQRTQATAAPLATARGLLPIIVATTADTAAHAKAVAQTVRAQAAAVVLVVGHSNTVPAIITALGGPAVAAIADDDYGQLYLLWLGAGPARLLTAKY
jgi:broad specificity phosphatase PhoE